MRKYYDIDLHMNNGEVITIYKVPYILYEYVKMQGLLVEINENYWNKYKIIKLCAHSNSLKKDLIINSNNISFIGAEEHEDNENYE